MRLHHFEPFFSGQTLKKAQWEKILCSSTLWEKTVQEKYEIRINKKENKNIHCRED